IVNNNLIAQNPIGNDYANVNQNSFVNGSNNQHFFNDNFINQNASNNQNNFVNRNNISSTPMVNNGLTTFIEPTNIINNSNNVLTDQRSNNTTTAISHQGFNFVGPNNHFNNQDPSVTNSFNHNNLTRYHLICIKSELQNALN